MMRVALIGAGRIGQVHAAAIRREADVERLVVCDPDGATAERVAARIGAAAFYEDVERMLTAEHPQVVHVCTPPTTHAEVAIQALEAGARVLVEKPLALESGEVARLATALSTRPGALCVDHNFLFEPEVVTARRWVAEGQIGDVLAAEMFYGVDTIVGAAGPGAWAQTLPGGRFTDLLPHGLYLVMHFLGGQRGVAARRGRTRRGATPSELGVVLECERGLGAIRVSLAAAPWEMSFTLRGTAGTIRVDLARQRAVLARHRSARRRRLGQLETGLSVGWQTAVGAVDRVVGKLNGRLRGYPGMRTLIARFYESVRRDLPPPVPFGDGAQVVGALQRIRDCVEERGGGTRPGIVIPIKHRA